MIHIYAIVTAIYLILQFLLGFVNADSTALGGMLLCIVEASFYVLPVAGAFIVARMVEARALPKTSETDDFLLAKVKNVSLSEAMKSFDFQLLCVNILLIVGVTRMMDDNFAGVKTFSGEAF